jgi:hypothetical protein
MIGDVTPEPWENPRYALGIVVILCVVCLILRLYFFDLGFVLGILALGFCAVCAAVGLGIAVLAIWSRPMATSAVPLAVLCVTALLWFEAPWRQAYLRTVWAVHQRQYTAIVRGLRAGSLVAGRDGRIVDGAGKPVRPEAYTDADWAGPLPNVYFILEGDMAFDWRPFGFVYTTNGNAQRRSVWPLGAEPTELKPHWYVLND